MPAARQSTFQGPLLLLAMGDLALLGARLWPWSDATSLPGNGTTALDPAICLVAYILLSFMIGSARDESSRKALFMGGIFGIFAGGALLGQMVLAARAPVTEDVALDRVQIALLVVSAALCAGAAIRSARGGHTVGFSALCAAWAAMVAGLLGCAYMIAQGYLIASPQQLPDAWRDYQGIAIGTPATQELVHALNTAAAYLLLGPLAAAVAGALVASFTRRASD